MKAFSVNIFLVSLSIVFLLNIGCNNVEHRDKDMNDVKKEAPAQPKETVDKPVVTPASELYANERFKEVRVERLGGNKFRITGKAQIFEANFGWVIEDGHNELQKGNQMTDAGAPEWGHFDFTVDAVKQNENSTLHLILFESSAKDGSRQHELPIKLY